MTPWTAGNQPWFRIAAGRSAINTVIKYSLGLGRGQCKPCCRSRPNARGSAVPEARKCTFQRLATSMQTPVELTAYRPEFRERLVTLWRASFASGVGAAIPHPLDDHLRYFDEHVLVETSVQLALRDGELVGFGAFTPESVMQLYVHVDHLGQGIGTRLLEHAKACSGGRLWLYTFVTNANAQRFYERHGFDVVERGFEPVMQLGDLRYEWRRPA